MNEYPLITYNYNGGFKPKSKLIIGRMEIYLEKHFNWFNRLMFKTIFGLKIENLGGNNE